ncbi:MAG: trypsin-like peptidase domain-containing protein [Clostridia bacterium]|nr:trypsin-like peptidase domain-containing protein [Clostridia bacterium]
MEDWINNPQEPEAPETPVEPTAPEAPAEPEVPVETPTTEPVEPPTLPTNRYASYTPYGAAPQPQMPQPPKKKNRNVPIIVLVCVLAVVFLASVILAVGDLADRGDAEDHSDGTTTTTTTAQAGSKPSLNIRDDDDIDSINTAQIVADNVDVTVLINVYELTAAEDYFGYNIESGEKTEKLAGQASGIVMSADGYIITNEHVVIDDSTGQPFDRVEVQFYNGNVYNATVVGHDSDTDLAVVKIEASDLKVATFGNSDNVVLGERVVTIGCSGGLPWSISQGIISGKDRDVYDETGYQIQCLQIDATINPGNSGGPLFNSRGEVIGINSAKIVYEGYENLGFSIPITEAKAVIDDLIQYGKVTGRIVLGITGYDVDQSGITGFLIKTIEKGSCLEGTGIKASDVLAAVDGVKVSGRTEMRKELSKHKAGDVVTLTVLRVTARRQNGGYFGYGASYTYEYDTFDVKVTLQEG